MNTIMVVAAIFASGTAIGITATTYYWQTLACKAFTQRDIAIDALLAIRCTTTSDPTRACLEHEREAEAALDVIAAY